MAFGAVRKAYKAPARFFADDPAADNQIIWYNVPDDTEIYDDWTVFTPRVDTPPNEATNAYEREGLGRIVRTFYDGVDVFGFPGTHTHGDAEDFRGLALRKKYFVGDVPPLPPCPDIRAFVRFGIGIQVDEMLPPPEGCACNSSTWPLEFDMIIDAPDYPEIDGQILHMAEDGTPDACHYSGEMPLAGGTLSANFTCWIPETGFDWLYVVFWDDSPYGDWELAGGLTPAEIFSAPWGFEHSDTVAIDFVDTENVAVIRTVGVIVPMRVGFSIGLTVSDPPPPPETIPLGLSIGLTVTDPPPPPPLPLGFMMGLTVTDP